MKRTPFAHIFIIIAFLINILVPVPSLQAQEFSINQLPVPGSMISESAPFSPLALKGLIINPQKPLEFQFIVNAGSDVSLRGEQATKRSELKQQANQLVKYFLAGLTIPEGDLWVNLSPYEKNRIVPEALGQTDLGRDLLAQDYILKQLTSSLIYPEKDLGKKFWSKVYQKAQQQFGTTNIPVNTFNKVWILPDQAQVYENVNAAYVTKSTLRVMLDEDYTALQKHRPIHNSTDSIGSQIVRQIILPEIEKEVNAGKNFAPLRQIYQALILAKWYKETIQNGLLDAVYTNKNKVAGVNLNDPSVKEQIYNRYLQAYKKGAFNYIKEDPTPDGQFVPRKYFSGGTLLKIDHLDRDGAMTAVEGEGNFSVKVFLRAQARKASIGREDKAQGSNPGSSPQPVGKSLDTAESGIVTLDPGEQRAFDDIQHKVKTGELTSENVADFNRVKGKVEPFDDVLSLPNTETGEYQSLVTQGSGVKDAIGFSMGGLSTRTGGLMRLDYRLLLPDVDPKAHSMIEWKLGNVRKYNHDHPSLKKQVLIMTSRSIEDIYKGIRKGMDYFGLRKSGLSNFDNGLQERISLESSSYGEVAKRHNGEIITNPPGHYAFIRQMVISGLLAQVKRQGVQFIYHSNLTNWGAVLNDEYNACKGLFLEKINEAKKTGTDIPMTMIEVAKENDPSKVGAYPALVNGKFSLLRYDTMPKDFDRGRFKYFNTANYYFYVDEIMRKIGLEDNYDTQLTPEQIAEKFDAVFNIKPIVSVKIYNDITPLQPAQPIKTLQLERNLEDLVAQAPVVVVQVSNDRIIPTKTQDELEKERVRITAALKGNVDVLYKPYRVENISNADAVEQFHHQQKNIQQNLSADPKISAMQKKTIVVVGASGFVGKKIVKTFQDSQVPVFGTGLTNAPQMYKLDVTNEYEIRAFVEKVHPDIIVYTAAEADPSKAEQDDTRAKQLNVQAVSFFSKYFNGGFLYFSSDYVFDGKSPPYAVDATPHAVNKYGQTKIDGEEMTRRLFGNNAAILRMGLLYGFNDDNDRSNFVRDVIRKLDDGDIVKADNQFIRYPLIIDDVANAVFDIVKNETSGILHFNGDVGVTKFQLAQMIAEEYVKAFPHGGEENKIKGLVVEASESSIARPLNAQMVNSIVPTSLRDGIRHVIPLISRRLKGGSFNKTFVHFKEGRKLVRKEALPNENGKLAEQIKYLLSVPRSVKKYFPGVLEYSLGDGKEKGPQSQVFYDMPYYQGKTFTNMIMDGDIDAKQAQLLLEQVMKIWSNDLVRSSKVVEPDKEYIQKLINRIQSSLKQVREKAKVFGNVLDAPFIDINGKKYRNVLPILDEISKNKTLMGDLSPPRFCLYHGDFHFDNIYFTKDGGVKFLDPRGEFKGDLIYDLAKIMHTVEGKYDILNHDLEKTQLTLQDGQVEISVQYPESSDAWKIYNELEKSMPDTLKRAYKDSGSSLGDPFWQERLFFTVAIQMINLPLYHLKNDGKEERSLALYAAGVRFLNDFIAKADLAMLQPAHQDKAALAKVNPVENGGIDLNQINVLRHGKTVNVQFDPVQLNQLIQGGFEGFSFEIESMTPISSPFQLLGKDPAEEEVLAKV